MPEEVPELPVHCIIQCQRRFRSFRSIVLYSVRGGSGASGPLWHCIIQWTGSSGTSSGIRRNLSWGTICSTSRGYAALSHESMVNNWNNNIAGWLFGTMEFL